MRSQKNSLRFQFCVHLATTFHSAKKIVAIIITITAHTVTTSHKVTFTVLRTATKKLVIVVVVIVIIKNQKIIVIIRARAKIIITTPRICFTNNKNNYKNNNYTIITNHNNQTITRNSKHRLATTKSIIVDRQLTLTTQQSIAQTPRQTLTHSSQTNRVKARTLVTSVVPRHVKRIAITRGRRLLKVISIKIQYYLHVIQIWNEFVELA